MKDDRPSYLWYMFGFGQSDEMLPEQIDVVRLGSGLFAFCQPVPISDFGEDALVERLKDMAWVAKQVQWHENQLKAILQHQQVLPARFATVFYSADSLRGSMEGLVINLRLQLEALADQFEWNAKLYVASPNGLSESVETNSPTLAALAQEMREASTGRGYLLKKKYEQTYEQAYRDWTRQFISQIADALAVAQVPFEHLNLPASKEALDKQPDLLANFALLLPTRDRALAAENVGDLLAGLSGIEHLAIELNGPLPPYHFRALDTDSQG